jgi:hypothetical protein
MLGFGMNEEELKVAKRFSKALEDVGKYLDVTVEISSNDADGIEFAMDGFKFILTWENVMRQSIGREVEVVQYTLSYWKGIAATYDEPEGVEDIALITNQSIYPCVRKAFLFLEEVKIESAMEYVVWCMGGEVLEEF